MHGENINQDKQQSKIHSKLQEFKFNARNWFDDTIQELKTNPSHAVWKISSAAVFFVAVISFLYTLYSLITAYAMGAVHFELSTNGTSFGLIYLSGWVGMLVSLLIGTMLISMAISFVSESKGVVRILGEILTGLIIVGYVMRFLLVGDLGIFINNAEMIDSLALFYDKICYSLSLSFGVLPTDVINGVLFVMYAPYIGLILLIWFSDIDMKFELNTSLKVFLCIQVLFRIVLWILDNLGGILWFVSILIAGLVILWVFGSALSGSSGDHSIFTNDLGEEIRIDRTKRV